MIRRELLIWSASNSRCSLQCDLPSHLCTQESTHTKITPPATRTGELGLNFGRDYQAVLALVLTQQAHHEHSHGTATRTFKVVVPECNLNNPTCDKPNGRHLPSQVRSFLVKCSGAEVHGCKHKPIRQLFDVKGQHRGVQDQDSQLQPARA